MVPAPTQPMTLGRFVRVTLQNFRQLINTFSGSDETPAMSNATHTGQEVQEPTTAGGSVAHAAKEVDADADIANGVEPAHTEIAATPDPGSEKIQPALDLPTESAEAILTAETESGQLQVRIGEASLAMQSALESLLFVADAPVEATQLARVVSAPVEVVETYLRRLDEEYRAQERGVRVAERSGRFQIVTAPAAAMLVEAFLNLDMTTKLSAPALETLAIVAYRQPVTRAQVEAVRGVDCSGILRSLLQRGLVEEVDRLDAPGRPVLYGVTDLFMHHFGLTNLRELPPLQAVEAEQLDGVVEQ